MYKSPFSYVNKDIFQKEPPKEMGFRGTLKEVIDFIEENPRSISLIKDEQTLLNRIFHSARPLRFALDYHIAHRGKLPLVRSAISLLEESYKGNCEKSVSAFKNACRLQRISLEEQEISQVRDPTSWKGYDVALTETTAKNIQQYSPFLFISLGHGSPTVGMDVFLQAQEGTISNNVFHSIRFSRTKSYKDLTLQVHTCAERAFLESEAQGRNVILFDEDSQTGNTLFLAEQKLTKILPNNIIRAISNYQS